MALSALVVFLVAVGWASSSTGTACSARPLSDPLDDFSSTSRARLQAVTLDVSAVCRAFRCPVRLAVPDLAGQLGHLRDSGWSAGCAGPIRP